MRRRPRYFDQLAAYGNSAELGGVFRWIIDTNSDGVVTIGDRHHHDFAADAGAISTIAGAIPVAGNFDNNANNGDEIGLYNSGKWVLDTNHNFVIEAGEVLIDQPARPADRRRLRRRRHRTTWPCSTTTCSRSTWRTTASPTRTTPTLVWGFPGVLDRPVAADMDQDGIDDIGLWVPRNSANPPRRRRRVVLPGVERLRRPSTPGAHDRHGSSHAQPCLYADAVWRTTCIAEFGDELAMPIVGNFDPPVVIRRADTIRWPATTTATAVSNNADYECVEEHVWLDVELGRRRQRQRRRRPGRLLRLAEPHVGTRGGGLAASMAAITTAAGKWPPLIAHLDQLVRLARTGCRRQRRRIVNAADYTVWRNNLATGGHVRAEAPAAASKRMRSSFRTSSGIRCRACGICVQRRRTSHRPTTCRCSWPSRDDRRRVLARRWKNSAWSALPRSSRWPTRHVLRTREVGLGRRLAIVGRAIATRVTVEILESKVWRQRFPLHSLV